ncbi:MAG TPA: MFS transporter [Dehalococcoidales bacterium]|nr:MFS transporter [Dehalococcoidales bacterium]
MSLTNSSPSDAGNKTPATHGLKSTFYALGVRNYRYFWLGNLGAFFSNHMQQPTQAWLAYEITNSPLLLGLVWAAQGISQVIIAPIGGIVIDRIQKRNLIMMAQTVAIALNLTIAILITLGIIQFWHLLLVSFLNGITNAFNSAARNSIVPELVPKDRVYNAIALNNGGANIARIAGPALAGLLIGFIGTQGAYFTGIGFSLLAVLTISFLPPTSKLGLMKTHSVLANIRDGFQYLKLRNILLILLMMEVAITFFGMCYLGLMPVFARLLNADSTGYGLMMSAIGVGSLTGAFSMASMGSVKRKGLVLMWVGILFGLFLILFGNAVHIGNLTNIGPLAYIVALVCLAAVGFNSTSYTATSLTLIQMNTSDEYRGRVISMYQFVIAFYPISILVAGALANTIGAPLTLTIGGGLLMVFMLLMLLVFRKIKNLV